jgi:UDP-GlcNAc:undecaprenyl-phosphate GlcNAc-1-phosphate transferase
VHIGLAANIIITFLWVLGIANAINHLDVMDGLAGTVTLIAGLSFFIISNFGRDANSAIFSLVLCSAVLSFLFFNFPPAKIYMGNSGSHFLGFVLAAIALNISYAPIEKKVALLSPLLILGFPIFDTAFLILARLSKRKIPFKKSNDHPALLFQAAGYSKRKTLFILGGLCLFFSVVGLMVKWSPSPLGITMILAAIAVTSFMVKKAYNIANNG